MKLSYLINKVDKNPENSANVPDRLLFETTNVFGSEIYLEEHGFSAYWLAKRLDTDTVVGLYVLFLDNEAVAAVYQKTRKSDEKILWMSESSFKKVREKLLDITKNLDFEVEKVDLDEEMEEGYGVCYGSELLTKSLVVKDTGEKVVVNKIYRGAENMRKWTTVTISGPNGNRDMNIYDLIVPYCINT